MKNKDVLCDSSSLISLGDSCLDNVFYFLHEKFGVRFLIPPEVEYEVVTRPLSGGLFQYYFSALKMQKAIHDKVLATVPRSDNEPLTGQILEAANNLFFIRGGAMRLVHPGEAGMIAAAKQLGISTILIDERTTRMLIEAPDALKKHLEGEFGVHAMVNRKNLERLAELTKGLNVIRSCELLVLAYEHGFLDRFPEKQKALEAGLYRVRFSGCSLSLHEIQEFVKR